MNKLLYNYRSFFTVMNSERRPGRLASASNSHGSRTRIRGAPYNQSEVLLNFLENGQIRPRTAISTSKQKSRQHQQIPQRISKLGQAIHIGSSVLNQGSQEASEALIPKQRNTSSYMSQRKNSQTTLHKGQVEQQSSIPITAKQSSSNNLPKIGSLSKQKSSNTPSLRGENSNNASFLAINNPQQHLKKERVTKRYSHNRPMSTQEIRSTVKKQRPNSIHLQSHNITNLYHQNQHQADPLWIQPQQQQQNMTPSISTVLLHNLRAKVNETYQMALEKQRTQEKMIYHQNQVLLQQNNNFMQVQKHQQNNYISQNEVSSTPVIPQQNDARLERLRKLQLASAGEDLKIVEDRNNTSIQHVVKSDSIKTLEQFKNLNNINRSNSRERNQQKQANSHTNKSNFNQLKLISNIKSKLNSNIKSQMIKKRSKGRSKSTENSRSKSKSKSRSRSQKQNHRTSLAQMLSLEQPILTQVYQMNQQPQKQRRKSRLLSPQVTGSLGKHQSQVQFYKSKRNSEMSHHHHNSPSHLDSINIQLNNVGMSNKHSRRSSIRPGSSVVSKQQSMSKKRISPSITSKKQRSSISGGGKRKSMKTFTPLDELKSSIKQQSNQVYIETMSIDESSLQSTVKNVINLSAHNALTEDKSLSQIYFDSIDNEQIEIQNQAFREKMLRNIQFAMLDRFHEGMSIMPNSERYKSEDDLDGSITEQTPTNQRREMPVLRTTFGLFDENYLYKFINQYSEEKLRSDEYMEFKSKAVTSKMMCKSLLGHRLQYKDLIKSARKEKCEIIAQISKECIKEVDDPMFRIGVDKPYEKVQLLSWKSELQNSQLVTNFQAIYRPGLNHVKVENFKEKTKQWYLSYDPFSSEKMLQIYGRDAPHSFKIRQEIIQEQKVILQRYTFPQPVLNATDVNQEIQEIMTKEKRDYLSQKAFLRFKMDSQDLNNMYSEVRQTFKQIEWPTSYEHFKLSMLEEAHDKACDGVTRRELQDLIEERLNKLYGELDQLDILTDQFLQAFDQSDFEQRLKNNKQVLETLDFDKDRIVSYQPPVNPKFFKDRKKTFPPDRREFPELDYEVIFHCIEALRKWLPVRGHLCTGYNGAVNHRDCYNYLSSKFVLEKELMMDEFMDKLGTTVKLAEENIEVNFIMKKQKFLSVTPDMWELSIFKTQVVNLYTTELLLCSPSLIDKSLKKILHKAWIKEDQRLARERKAKFERMKTMYDGQDAFPEADIDSQLSEEVYNPMNHIMVQLHVDLGHKHTKSVLGDGQQDCPKCIERFFTVTCYLPCAQETGINGRVAEVFELHNLNNCKLTEGNTDLIQKSIQDRMKILQKEIQTMIQERKQAREKKMKKYKMSNTMHLFNHNKSQEGKLQRIKSVDTIQRAPRPENSQVVDLYIASLHAVTPFTQDFLQLNLKRKEFADAVQKFTMEDFVPLKKPNLEKQDISNLRSIKEEIKLVQDGTKKIVKTACCGDGDDNEPKISPLIRWLSFMDIVDDHSESAGHHHHHHDDDADACADSDHSSEDLVQKCKTGSESVFLSPDILQHYFNKQLRKELIKAVDKIDLQTITNYAISLEGTLDEVVNQQDSSGNSLLHLAIMKLDKQVTSDDDVRERALNIVKVLLSSKCGGNIHLHNNLGNRPVDYAKNIRNKDDQQEILEVIQNKKL